MFLFGGLQLLSVLFPEVTLFWWIQLLHEEPHIKKKIENEKIENILEEPLIQLFTFLENKNQENNIL